jgi:hypothetical protein
MTKADTPVTRRKAPEVLRPSTSPLPASHMDPDPVAVPAFNLSTLASSLAVLDVSKGRSKLVRHFKGNLGKGGRIPVLIYGSLVSPWGGDDGTSQEFAVDVEWVGAPADLPAHLRALSDAPQEPLRVPTGAVGLMDALLSPVDPDDHPSGACDASPRPEDG